MSDIPKFIKHFKASAAYHRKKAEQAEAEVARLEALLPSVRPTMREADGGDAPANKPSSDNASDGYVKCFVCGRMSMRNDKCEECGYGTPLWWD